MHADEQESTHVSDTVQPAMQVSLGTLMLMMLVFSIISAGLYHASRVPAINEEWQSLFGRSGTSTHTDRSLHIVFLLFTYTTPLLMAGLLSTATGIWSWWQRRSRR